VTNGSTLHVDLKVGESLSIGELLTISVEEKSGRRARLRFVFAEPIEVRRTKRSAQADPTADLRQPQAA